MPVTRKEKSKARRSREAEMISDLENMDVMIGSGHSGREDIEFGNSVRRPESHRYDALTDNNSNSQAQERMEPEGFPEKVKKLLKQVLVAN